MLASQIEPASWRGLKHFAKIPGHAEVEVQRELRPFQAVVESADRRATVVVTAVPLPGEDRHGPRHRARSGPARRERRQQDQHARRDSSRSSSQASFPRGRWRTLVRLQASLPHLAEEMKVSAVAPLVGCQTTSSFVAAFRAHTGVTPGRYFQRPAGASIPRPSTSVD